MTRPYQAESSYELRVSLWIDPWKVKKVGGWKMAKLAAFSA
jgi:hypothetical protein